MIHPTYNEIDSLLMCGKSSPFTFKFKNMEYQCNTAFAELLSEFVLILHRSDPIADYIEFDFYASKEYFEIFKQYINNKKYSIHNLPEAFKFYIGIGCYDLAYETLAHIPINSNKESVDKFIQMLKHPFTNIELCYYPTIDQESIKKIPLDGLVLLNKNPKYNQFANTILIEINDRFNKRKKVVKPSNPNTSSQTTLQIDATLSFNAESPSLEDYNMLKNLPIIKSTTEKTKKNVFFDTSNAPPISGVFLAAKDCEVNIKVTGSINGTDVNEIISGIAPFQDVFDSKLIIFDEPKILHYDFIFVEYSMNIEKEVEITLFSKNTV